MPPERESYFYEIMGTLESGILYAVIMDAREDVPLSAGKTKSYGRADRKYHKRARGVVNRKTPNVCRKIQSREISFFSSRRFIFSEMKQHISLRFRDSQE